MRWYVQHLSVLGNGFLLPCATGQNAIHSTRGKSCDTCLTWMVLYSVLYSTSYPSDLIFLERLCSLRYLVSLDILIRFGGAARILPTLCSSPLRHIANAGVYFTKYLPPGPAPGISRRTALPTRWARVQGALTVVPVIIPSLSCQGRRNRLSRYAADILLLQYSNMAMAR